MGDLIDRQEALKKLAAYIHMIDKTMGKGTLTDDDCMEAAKSVLGEDELPAAQPEQRWIPCSERLPEEHEWIGTKKFGTTISDEVYVTFESPKGERFTKHLNFQNGKVSSFTDVFYKGAVPIAWMPLPASYKGE